jgi:hypothetical protein
MSNKKNKENEEFEKYKKELSKKIRNYLKKRNSPKNIFDKKWKIKI